MKQTAALIFSAKGRTWAKGGGKDLAHRTLEYGRALATCRAQLRTSAQRQCGGVITSGLSGAVRRAVTSAGFTEMGTTQQVYKGARGKKQRKKPTLDFFYPFFHLAAAVYPLPVSFVL